MNRRNRLSLLGIFSALLLGGCASKVPVIIGTPPGGDIRVDEVQQKQNSFIDAKVRWGGDIISVENLADETHIEILARQLNETGKPKDESRSSGRFLARIEGYLEPEEYPKDQKITVTGSVIEVIKKPVGDYPYPYPVVDVEAYYLWPKQKHYSRPYYYDPFYDPFYYPYWRRYPYYYW
ncbi:MAG: Slp family lipoprotein [Candidatus Thiodiazotropha sp. (ex Lucinoma annulata)]|nr:Slp family lipoprotein [Candidatus Thiodiazotropha sp. (ex Lucinoma borealis)]MCU7885715.1 Slp family lipoprotein [Candidatus Thiodiazotropha sp. (ex Lucinoma annulata)]MCU7945435.1 Slp family lipoprotein [Candidatus Thiodiazotropha sp. (ex Cardiolucina cf. quadrata)]MCU7857483.1 Slp family lipoprotein [Candidatus Thiodiazotropha sp. (ex Lucinoma borealis)]MCU7866057.1 Slp family lipoprotein [Candidatus Thiodiazotropha sp. (ex Lucinoma borealis)]